jgi:hypothetical protein
MTKLEALTELAANVEAGMFRPTFAGPEHTAFPGMEGGNSLIRHHIRYAYHGSLDAAKALHEALLPGWDIQITTYEDDSFEASVARPMEVRTYDGVSMYMARAWLLAIIRALIAEELTDALQDLADADRDLL